MFENLSIIFGRIINAIWAFLTAQTALGDFAEMITQFNNDHSAFSGFVQCVGAFINLTVPIRHIGIMIAIKLPVLFLAVILSLVYRAKSFIPTMGD